MTSIKSLREIVSHVRSLPNKNVKKAYLESLSPDILNFLAKNIQMDGIGKKIAMNMSSFTPNQLGIKNDMETIVQKFAEASSASSRLYKERIIRDILLPEEDRAFVLTCLYGSLKIGLTVPLPDPVFGERIRPQLCGTGIDFEPKDYIIERKFDGIRCIAMNIDDKVRLYTRNGKPIDAEVISKEIVDAIPPGYVLDGELESKDGEFQNMRRHSDDIVYNVFDMPFCNHFSTINTSLRYRRFLMNDDIVEQEHIKISPILNLNNIPDINKWIEHNHAEGIIAKNPESTYTYGGRKDWIKLKPFMDVSGWVVGFTQGEGKREGGIGAVVFKPDDINVTSLVGSGFNDNYLKLMKTWLNDGKKVRITVKFQDYTKDDHLRFPVFLRVDEII